MPRVRFTLPGGQSDYYYIDDSDNADQFKEALMTNQWNYAMAQEQNAWNIAQWNRENEYNKPVNQLARLSEAGINPLMLDKWQSLSANSPQAAGASATLPGYTPQGPQKLQALQMAVDAAQSAQNNSMDWLRLQNEQSRLRLDTAMNEEQLKAVRAGVGLTSSQRRGQDIANRRAYADYTMTSGSPEYRREFLNNLKYQNVSHQNVIDRQQMENKVYKSTMRALKQLPYKQLDKLLVDLKLAGEQGRLLEFKRTIRDKYHMDPDSDIWNNLLYMGLRDPDSYNTVISRLLKAFGNVIDKQSKSLGDQAEDFFNGLKSKFGRPRRFSPVSPGLPYYTS